MVAGPEQHCVFAHSSDVTIVCVRKEGRGEIGMSMREVSILAWLAACMPGEGGRDGR